MNKYLVFALEHWRKVNVANQPTEGDIVLTVYVEPKYEDRKFPCFELVKEFDRIEGTFIEIEAMGYARQYSLDNKVRTVVVKGTIFEG
jgi:hypothetical protein